MLSPGTISVSKHSATITGSGTDFDCDDNLEGKYIKVIGNDVWYLIKEVVSDTEITLDRAYRGETASNAYYELGHDSLWKQKDLLDKEEATEAGKFSI